MLRLIAVLTAVLATSARADEVCDARAELAGRIMQVRQSGAPQAALEQVMRQASDTLLAADLVVRAYAQTIGDDTDAREAATYHFAADVYEECRRGAALAHHAAV